MTVTIFGIKFKTNSIFTKIQFILFLNVSNKENLETH